MEINGIHGTFDMRNEKNHPGVFARSHHLQVIEKCLAIGILLVNDFYRFLILFLIVTGAGAFFIKWFVGKIIERIQLV
jgi:hypothetical protein